MALAGYPLTCESPKITHCSKAGGNVTVINAEGIDMIKITGSNIAGTSENSHADFDVWVPGTDISASGDKVSISAAAGDVVEGPFIKVVYNDATSTGTELDAFIYERARTTAS